MTTSAATNSWSIKMKFRASSTIRRWTQRPPRKRPGMPATRRWLKPSRMSSWRAVSSIKLNSASPGGRLHRVRQHRAPAGGRQQDAREIRAGPGGAAKSAGGSGQVESQLLHDCLRLSPASSARRPWRLARTFHRASSCWQWSHWTMSGSSRISRKRSSAA